MKATTLVIVNPRGHVDIIVNLHLPQRGENARSTDPTTVFSATAPTVKEALAELAKGIASYAHMLAATS